MLAESGEAQDETATLYYYDRPDTVGPKRSDYDFIRFSTIDEASVLKRMLSRSMGVRGIVKKGDTSSWLARRECTWTLWKVSVTSSSSRLCSKRRRRPQMARPSPKVSARNLA
ncbi:hypothetical protein MRX96_050114 [Rhipicephalus microplus]